MASFTLAAAKTGLCGLLALCVAASCFTTACAYQRQGRQCSSGGRCGSAGQGRCKSEAPAPSEPTAPTGEEQSMLEFFFVASGWFYTIVFLAISFVFVALVVMNLLAARRENIVPVALVQGFEQHLNDRKYQEAYELAKNDDSFLGHVLSAGPGQALAGLSAGDRSHAGGRRRRNHEARAPAELHRLDRHHQSHGRPVGHGRRHGGRHSW